MLGDESFIIGRVGGCIGVWVFFEYSGRLRRVRVGGRRVESYFEIVVMRGR